MTEIPDRVRRFLPEQPAPTPAERFDAYLAAHADGDTRWHVTSDAPPGRRTGTGFAVPLGFLAAVIAVLVWQVLA